MNASLRIRCSTGLALVALAAAFPVSAQTQFKIAGADVSVGLSASLEYDDNVRSSGLTKEGDLIARTAVRVAARWDITEFNYLSFGAEAGYEKYFDNSDLDTFDLNFDVLPGAGLRWNVKVGPATVVLRESLTFSTDGQDSRSFDPATGTVVSDPAEYRRFTNQAGVTVSFDVRGGELELTASRGDEIPLEDEFDYLRETTLAVGAGVLLPLRSDLEAGAYVRYEDRAAKNGVRNDATRFELGPRLQWRPSDFITVRASVFYEELNFDQTGSLAASDSSGLGWEAELRHELTKEWSHFLRTQRKTEYGQLANSRKVQSYSYGVDWSGLRWATVGGALTRSEEQDSGTGVLSESLDSWYFGVNLTSQTEGSLSWRASFDREDRDSNLAARTYGRNRLLFEVRYGF